MVGPAFASKHFNTTAMDFVRKSLGGSSDGENILLLNVYFLLWCYIFVSCSVFKITIFIGPCV